MDNPIQYTYIERFKMKFLKEANEMAAETLGSIKDAATMLRGAARAGVVYTEQWEDTARKNVQADLLEKANKMQKKVAKLMQDIDPEMMTLNKQGYYDLDLGKLIEAHKEN